MSWRDELRNLPAPEPPDDLLPRILADRAAGVRVVLPRGRPTASRRVALLLTAAAAILVLTTRGGGPRPEGTDNVYQDIAAALPFWPPHAMAQEAGPPRRPRYEPIQNLRVARAHGGTWTYRTCTVFDEVLNNCRGRLTITVSEAAREGRPAWLMVQQVTMVRDGPPTRAIRTPLDTTYVDAATLRPVYHAINGDQFHFVRRVTGDTVREALDIGGAYPRSWRSLAVIPGSRDAPLVLRWARFDVALLLQTLPLDRGWQGSVYSIGLVGRDPSKAAIAPIDLRVVGSGRIAVPAGTYDCWQVELRQGDETRLTLWTSKDRGWLVKTQDQGLDWRTESALLSITPPAP